MDSLRKTALVAGILYVLTFVSIPILVLYGPVRSDPNFIVSAVRTLPSSSGASWRSSWLSPASARP
jgi:hypothetical protein